MLSYTLVRSLRHLRRDHDRRWTTERISVALLAHGTHTHLYKLTRDAHIHQGFKNDSGILLAAAGGDPE